MRGNINFTMKQARQYAGKTQAECAKYLGICRTTYIRLEASPAQITIEQGKAFAQYVGIPIESISFV